MQHWYEGWLLVGWNGAKEMFKQKMVEINKTDADDRKILPPTPTPV
jgi:hypothetical protein